MEFPPLLAGIGRWALHRGRSLLFGAQSEGVAISPEDDQLRAFRQRFDGALHRQEGGEEDHLAGKEHCRRSGIGDGDDLQGERLRHSQLKGG